MNRLLRPILLAVAAATFPAAAQTPSAPSPGTAWPANRPPAPPAQAPAQSAGQPQQPAPQLPPANPNAPVPLPTWFSEIDTAKKGEVTRADFLKYRMKTFDQLDANKDGKLSLEEFQALWADLTRPIAVRAFQFLDPNGDAVLDRAEVDKRFGSIVARLDRNNDGKLSPEDRPHDTRWHHGWKDGRADNPEE